MLIRVDLFALYTPSHMDFAASSIPDWVGPVVGAMVACMVGVCLIGLCEITRVKGQRVPCITIN